MLLYNNTTFPPVGGCYQPEKSNIMQHLKRLDFEIYNIADEVCIKYIYIYLEYWLGAKIYILCHEVTIVAGLYR